MGGCERRGLAAVHGVHDVRDTLAIDEQYRYTGMV